jgi:hypothetical protein
MDKKFLVVSFESQTKKIAVQKMLYDSFKCSERQIWYNES